MRVSAYAHRHRNQPKEALVIRSRPSARSRPVHFLLLVPLLVVAVACSGGGGGSPTDPGLPTATGTASIQGQVSVSSGSGNLVIDLGSPSGTAGSGAPTALAAADSSGAGVTVRVQGTSLATTADASGAFQLGGVPHGNQVLVFETAQASAGVPVENIQANEHIRLSVRVSGGSAEVTDLDRDGGEDGMDDGNPDDGEDDGAGDAPELNLSLQLSPSTWNLNYDHSSGTVAAFIRGQGFRKVVLDSIVLVGDDPDADPLEPVGATREGDHVRARFAKNQVLDILDQPEKGSVHTVALQFEVDGVDEIQELSAQVRIVGDDDGGDDGEDDREEVGDLSLQLSPGTWNLNYDRANGSVTAFIRGQGLSAIDTGSVELVGDDPEADPLPASSARLEGNHVRAQFPKNRVLDLLDEPAKGSSHTVTVRFTSGDGAGSHELQAQVKVVGKDDD
jgi:hypothetical protein